MIQGQPKIRITQKVRRYTNYTESEKIYELQESVLKFQPPDGAAGEVNKITSPNSPCDQTLDCSNPGITLTILRIKNSENIIGHLNVNHIENKFEPFVSLVKDKLDIILLSETKIDDSFPPSQFAIEG